MRSSRHAGNGCSIYPYYFHISSSIDLLVVEPMRSSLSVALAILHASCILGQRQDNDISSTSKGNHICVNELMCIGVVTNGSIMKFELSPFKDDAVPGWMAIGFGERMANSSMFILWTNADGSVTLSQRQASGRVQPTVVPKPAHVATIVSTGAHLAARPTLSFAIPMIKTETLPLIWAYGNTNPRSSHDAALLARHIDRGALIIDISQQVRKASSPSNELVLLALPRRLLARVLPAKLVTYERMIEVHAALFSTAFLIVLPIGALVARLRTLNSLWFPSHWILQFYLAGPLVLAAFIVVVTAVKQHGLGHFNDTHKRVGLALFVMYIVQCAIGAFIHFVKSKRMRRPPQNYLHAVLGLAIIGLALYQVHLGYTTEWRLYVAGKIPIGVNVAWTVWVVVIPVLYTLGLFLLPRQLRQERWISADSAK